jgi:hypothetical protein
MLASRTWNLFSPKQCPSLHCAVWQDRPVPEFIQTEAWEFCGTVRAGEPVPVWFRLLKAREAMHLTGYYLFLAF